MSAPPALLAGPCARPFWILRVLAGIALAACLTGCSSVSSSVTALRSTGGELSLESDFEPGRQLSTNLSVAYYELTDPQTLTVVLADQPAEKASGGAPSQLVIIRLLWKPVAGSTPLDVYATNATIRHILLVEDQAGVYSGAGFVKLRGTPGDSKLELELLHSTLKLTDRSERFIDPLGHAGLTGRCLARLDAAGTEQLLVDIHRQLKDRLGYPRLVQAQVPPLLPNP